MAMSYVMPPMGVAYPHPSGTSGMSRDRPLERAKHWDKPWVQAGTGLRAGFDFRPRKLCHYNLKGHATVIMEIPAFASTKATWWYSEAPPDMDGVMMTVHPAWITSYKRYEQASWVVSYW